MSEPGEGAELDGLWACVLGAWDDDESHGALLEFALRVQALPAVAARYRMLVDDPAKGQRARQKLDALAAAATNMLLSTRTPRSRGVPVSITLSAGATCALLLAWLAWALWRGH